MAHGFAIWGGPVATIIASITAATITFVFSKRQVGIAREQKDIAASQRDIALEKLKADLFERRSKVYRAARDASLYAMRQGRNVQWIELRNKTDVMQDCTFLFSKEIADYLLDYREKLIEYGTDVETMTALPMGSDDYEVAQVKNRKVLNEIGKTYYELPKRLRTEMGVALPPSK